MAASKDGTRSGGGSTLVSMGLGWSRPTNHAGSGKAGTIFFALANAGVGVMLPRTLSPPHIRLQEPALPPCPNRTSQGPFRAE